MTTVQTIEYVPLAALTPDPRNPRTHSKKQVQLISNSIESSEDHAYFLSLPPAASRQSPALIFSLSVCSRGAPEMNVKQRTLKAANQ